MLSHTHTHVLLFPIVSFCGCRCRHFIFYQAISVCLNKIIFYLYLPFYVSFFETSLLLPHPQSQLFKALEVTFNILIMVDQPAVCNKGFLSIYLTTIFFFLFNAFCSYFVFCLQETIFPLLHEIFYWHLSDMDVTHQLLLNTPTHTRSYFYVFNKTNIKHTFLKS